MALHCYLQILWWKRNSIEVRLHSRNYHSLPYFLQELNQVEEYLAIYHYWRWHAMQLNWSNRLLLFVFSCYWEDHEMLASWISVWHQTSFSLAFGSLLRHFPWRSSDWFLLVSFIRLFDVSDLFQRWWIWRLSYQQWNTDEALRDIHCSIIHGCNDQPVTKWFRLGCCRVVIHCNG